MTAEMKTVGVDGASMGASISESDDRRRREAEATDNVRRRIELLGVIVRCAAPVLAWDTEKADAWLPGLKAALQALKDEEKRCAQVAVK